MNYPQLISSTGRLPTDAHACDVHISALLGQQHHNVRHYGLLADHSHLQSKKYVPSVEMSAPDYLDSIKSGTAASKGLYWAMFQGTDKFQHDLKRLLSMATAQKTIGLNWSAEEAKLSFWLCPPTHTEHLHYDGYSNLHFQLRGSKTWTLFPPNTNLLPVSICQSVFSPLGGQQNFSTLTMDMAKSRSIEPPIVIEVHAGECIYVPAGWWHEVRGGGGGGGGGSSGGGGDSGNEGEDEVEWVCSVNWFEPSSSSTCRCRNVRWKFLRLLVGEWIDYVVDQCRTVVPTVELPAPRVIH